MLKSMQAKDMVETIRQVYAGKKRIPPEIAAHLAEHYNDETLTSREVEILQQIAGGNRNRDIAEKLLISEETVKVHIKHVMEKLGANKKNNQPLRRQQHLYHLKAIQHEESIPWRQSQ